MWWLMSASICVGFHHHDEDDEDRGSGSGSGGGGRWEDVMSVELGGRYRDCVKCIDHLAVTQWEYTLTTCIAS